MKDRPRKLSDAFSASENADPVTDTFGGEMVPDDGAKRCGILVRVSPALRHRIKCAALNRGVTVQDLVLEGISGVLQKIGQ